VPFIESRLYAFTLRVLVVLALLALALFLWQIADVLLLAFGAALVAILLRAVADPIRHHTGLPNPVALAIAVGLVLAAIAGAAWLFGHEVGKQMDEIFRRVPRAWDAVRQRLEQYELGVLLMQGLQDSSAGLGGIASRVPQGAAMLSTAVLHLLVIMFGGIYFAVDPRIYRQGLLKLFPENARPRVGGMADASVKALRLWLRGQLITMAIVGVLTGVCLWLAGVPAPLALGLLAGLLEFVPYLGPILAAVPGLLLAFTVGPDVLVYAILVYIVVQQIEANVILPMVARQVLELPPALVIFSVLALGLVFGTLGWIFAAPLTVLLVVAVGRLYVRETLDTPAKLPGEAPREKA
jgi:predicted PurR-regulated permease PerM